MPVNLYTQCISCLIDIVFIPLIIVRMYVVVGKSDCMYAHTYAFICFGPLRIVYIRTYVRMYTYKMKSSLYLSLV